MWNFQWYKSLARNLWSNGSEILKFTDSLPVTKRALNVLIEVSNIMSQYLFHDLETIELLMFD